MLQNKRGKTLVSAMHTPDKKNRKSWTKTSPRFNELEDITSDKQSEKIIANSNLDSLGKIS